MVESVFGGAIRIMAEDDQKLSTSVDQMGSGWQSAAALVKPVSVVAANFSEAVRTLLSYYDRDVSSLTLGAQNHLLRLIRSNTVKATYYFASQAYRPTIFTSGGQVNPQDFLKGYSPLEHAVLLSFCYLFRSLSKKSNKEEWDYIQAPLYEALEIGACIGRQVPQVGLGFGLLSRGMRYLAFAPLLISDRKAFQDYRKHLRSKDLPFDMAREQQLWGCTNIQVAALLMEIVGFNRLIALQFVAAAERDVIVQPENRYGVPFRIAEVLLEAYMETGEIPESLPAWVGANVGLSSAERSNLLSDLSATISSSNRIEWLNKSSGSVNITSTPELFS